jgi:hypothetical protein
MIRTARAQNLGNLETYLQSQSVTARWRNPISGKQAAEIGNIQPVIQILISFNGVVSEVNHPPLGLYRVRCFAMRTPNHLSSTVTEVVTAGRVSLIEAARATAERTSNARDAVANPGCCTPPLLSLIHAVGHPQPQLSKRALT